MKQIFQGQVWFWIYFFFIVYWGLVILELEQFLYEVLRDGCIEELGFGVFGENFKGKYKNFYSKKFIERKINFISLICVFELWFVQC